MLAVQFVTPQCPVFRQQREVLAKKNKDTLYAIEASMFVLVFDDKTPRVMFDAYRLAGHALQSHTCCKTLYLFRM